MRPTFRGDCTKPSTEPVFHIQLPCIFVSGWLLKLTKRSTKISKGLASPVLASCIERRTLE